MASARKIARAKQRTRRDRTAIANIGKAVRLGGVPCRNADRLNTTGVGRDCQAMAVAGQLDHRFSRLETDAADQSFTLERRWIDRVVSYWLTLLVLAQESAIQLQGAPTQPPLWDKAGDRDHRRFVHGVEALARLR